MADSASTTIELLGDSTNVNSKYIGLDDVSVSPVNGAVPEVSTWVMMVAGFASLGFAGYRRTTKTRAAA
jgi:hypothetical protein